MAQLTSFWPLLEQLRSGIVFDLTHHLDQGFPIRVQDIQTLENDGVWSQEFMITRRCSTHIDSPAHRLPGKPTLDQMLTEDMILPLVVIDVHDRVAWNPDYMLTIADVAAWEAEFGRIPPRSFVVMRTDWGNRWPDDHAFHNIDEDGICHWPGWEPNTIRFLVKKRDIAVIGHETISTDGGIKTAEGHMDAEKLLSEYERYQVELLAHLDQVPRYGAIAIVSVLKIKNASSFPARVLAFAPHSA